MATIVETPPGALALPAVDAYALLDKALTSGAAVETVERLVALAERMHATQARSVWHDAMSSFQRGCPTIAKSRDAQIRTRGGGSYTYHYAPLDAILEAVRPGLGAVGLSVTWQHETTDTHAKAECLIAHTLGHVERSGWVSIPIEQKEEGGSGAGPAQRVGIAMTYARRYSLLAVLGLAPEDDDDAQSQHDGDAGPKPITRQDGSVIVLSVDEVKGGKPGQRAWTRYDVHFDDGSRAATFDQGLARAAEQAKADGVLCIPTVESTSRGVNLLSLTPAAMVGGGAVGEALEGFAEEVSGGAIDEAEERKRLNAEAKLLGTKLNLKAAERAELWSKFCGGNSPDEVAIVYLADLVKELRTRAGE